MICSLTPEGLAAIFEGLDGIHDYFYSKLNSYPRISKLFVKIKNKVKKVFIYYILQYILLLVLVRKCISATLDNSEINNSTIEKCAPNNLNLNLYFHISWDTSWSPHIGKQMKYIIRNQVLPEIPDKKAKSSQKTSQFQLVLFCSSIQIETFCIKCNSCFYWKSASPLIWAFILVRDQFYLKQQKSPKLLYKLATHNNK